MKLLKTFALFALIFAANSLSAQSVTSKWPAMKTYDDVITRINNGVVQGNPNVITNFTKTLAHFSQELTAKEIPAEYKTKKIQDAVAKLQKQTQQLDEMVAAKNPDATLKPVFLETYATFQQITQYMGESN
ncbi:MAG TPA: hypothetical protein VF676_08055 [Flavobacterium sp.]